MKNWYDELPSAVTITDDKGVIIYMNKKSESTFESDGGMALIGKNLLDCHNENSKNVIRKIETTLEPNIYTIEKKGKKKLIYQSPWFDSGKYAGLVEISIELPVDMQHFKRD